MYISEIYFRGVASPLRGSWLVFCSLGYVNGTLKRRSEQKHETEEVCSEVSDHKRIEANPFYLHIVLFADLNIDLFHRKRSPFPYPGEGTLLIGASHFFIGA